MRSKSADGWIGRAGFYPAWCRGAGRWVQQRPTAIPEFDADPPESYEWFVWAPRHRWDWLPFSARRARREDDRALHSLPALELMCPHCSWAGASPHIETVLERSGPEHWRLRCPICSGVRVRQLLGGVASVVPAIALTGEATSQEAKDRCVERWIALGCPALDYPGAAMFWLRPDPIADLAAWFASASSVATCLYVAQQLWRTYDEMVRALRGDGNTATRAR